MSDENWKERRDRLATEEGVKHAHPALRSMYPLTSRGVMATQFARLYQLGYHQGRADLLADAKKIVFAANDILETFNHGCGSDYCTLPECGCFQLLQDSIDEWRKKTEVKDER